MAASVREKKNQKNYPPQKKWPSSLKSESFENVLISIEVHSEISLFGKTSYQSEEAAQNIRRKATILVTSKQQAMIFKTTFGSAIIM